MSKKKEFLNHWLDCVVEGQPIGEWCKCIKHEARKAHCTYCNADITFGVNGLKTFRRHAASNKHRENRKVAEFRSKGLADNSSKHRKREETIDALSGLYPGMNFNCSVDLLPLSLLYTASKQIGSSDLASLLRRLVKPEAKNSFIDVYICFFCGEEFVTRPSLQSHQRECGRKLPELQTVPLEKTAVHQQDNFVSPSLPLFLCPSSEGPMTLDTTREQPTDPNFVPSKDSYISALGLLPKKKAVRVCNKRRNTECESIDLDEDFPISPSLPRTPKLLISHLSRDGNENCGENSSPSRVRRTLFSFQHSRTDKEANGKIGENDEMNKEENNGEKTKMSHAKSLYSLDLTSPLGQFVIKHIKGDPNLHVLSDVESHCLTSIPQKSSPAIQLRERHITYPITFKGLSGKFRSSHVHLYKFTHSQTAEFLQRINTGLDRKSRVLLRKMIPCKVRLTHITKTDLKKWMVSKKEVTVDLKPLSAEEITYWTSPKEVDTNSNTSAVFPTGLTFSSPNVNNVLGLKTCQDSPFLSMSNYVSEETFAEVTENRRTVYKSLLSDSTSNGSSTSETENFPTSVPLLRKILSSSYLHTSSQRPAQTVFGRADLQIDMTKNNVVASHSSSSSQMDKYGKKESNKSCSFLSSVNRCISYPSSALIDPYASLSVKLSNLSGGGSVSLYGDKTGQLSRGPVRSGIYNIQIRTALEGKIIKSSVKKFQAVSFSDRDSLERNGKIKNSSADGTKVLKSKSLFKSFVVSKRAHSPDVLNNHHFKKTDVLKVKKRKVATESSDPHQQMVSSVTVTSQKKAPLVSWLKCTESGRKHSSVIIDMTRATSAVEDALQRLSMDSLSSVSENQQNTPLVKNDFVQRGPEPSSHSTIVHERGHHRRRGDSHKSVGFYRKLAAVGTLRKNGVQKVSKALYAQTHAQLDRLINVKEREEQLTVADDESLRNSSKHEASSNEETGKSCVFNPSVMRNAGQINNKEEIGESKNIENRNAIDAISKKSVKIAQNTILQTHNPSESKLVSMKDLASTEFRFVTHSSPVSPPASPQLRQSSLINTISVPRRAEVRKSLLSSFLLKPNGASFNVSLTKEPLTKPSSVEQAKSTRDKFRYTSRSKEGK